MGNPDTCHYFLKVNYRTKKYICMGKNITSTHLSSSLHTNISYFVPWGGGGCGFSEAPLTYQHTLIVISSLTSTSNEWYFNMYYAHTPGFKHIPNSSLINPTYEKDSNKKESSSNPNIFSEIWALNSLMW